MKPEYFEIFVDSMTKILSTNEDFVALALGGSWIDGRMDRGSVLGLDTLRGGQNRSGRAYGNIDLFILHATNSAWSISTDPKQ